MAKPTLVQLEDCEGHGSCNSCGREGLRWIAVLSDGSRIGTECAKAFMGWKPAPRDYQWVVDFKPVARHDETSPAGDRAAWVLWRHRNGHGTNLTCNGRLRMVGGAQSEWERRGWA